MPPRTTAIRFALVNVVAAGVAANRKFRLSAGFHWGRLYPWIIGWEYIRTQHSGGTEIVLTIP
jgi:hypothetical protein